MRLWTLQWGSEPWEWLNPKLRQWALKNVFGTWSWEPPQNFGHQEWFSEPKMQLWSYRKRHQALQTRLWALQLWLWVCKKWFVVWSLEGGTVPQRWWFVPQHGASSIKRRTLDTSPWGLDHQIMLQSLRMVVVLTQKEALSPKFQKLASRKRICELKKKKGGGGLIFLSRKVLDPQKLFFHLKIKLRDCTLKMTTWAIKWRV